MEVPPTRELVSSNRVKSAPAQKARPAPVMTIPTTAGVGLRPFNCVTKFRRHAMSPGVKGSRAVESDESDRPIHL